MAPHDARPRAPPREATFHRAKGPPAADSDPVHRGPKLQSIRPPVLPVRLESAPAATTWPSQWPDSGIHGHTHQTERTASLPEFLSACSTEGSWGGTFWRRLPRVRSRSGAALSSCRRTTFRADKLSEGHGKANDTAQADWIYRREARSAGRLGVDCRRLDGVQQRRIRRLGRLARRGTPSGVRLQLDCERSADRIGPSHRTKSTSSVWRDNPKRHVLQHGLFWVYWAQWVIIGARQGHSQDDVRD